MSPGGGLRAKRPRVGAARSWGESGQEDRTRSSGDGQGGAGGVSPVTISARLPSADRPHPVLGNSGSC